MAFEQTCEWYIRGFGYEEVYTGYTMLVRCSDSEQEKAVDVTKLKIINRSVESFEFPAGGQESQSLKFKVT